MQAKPYHQERARQAATGLQGSYQRKVLAAVLPSGAEV